MLRRNWLDLSRKLVDRYDMDFSFGALQEALGEYALSWFGEGVLNTTTYPNPFPLTMSGIALGGTVGNGIGFDPNGQITRIDSSSPTSKSFTIPTADPSHPRWDLLVIRYKSTGDTPVPKPSDPILTISLNLHDDFQLVVIPGTPSASPAYPAKGSLDIILAGLRVPTGTLVGTSVTVDLGIREIAQASLASYPVIVEETPTGAINGSNKSFVISQSPVTSGSLWVMIDGEKLPHNQYVLSGLTITTTDAPAPGQDLVVKYIVNSTNSVNPLAANQEFPSGSVDGTNKLFSLVGKVADNNGAWLYIDGGFIPNTKWDLIQQVSTSQIQYHPGEQPNPGQIQEIVYLVNPATVGVGPPPPSSDGALSVAGSIGSPLAINGASGITSTSNQRQLMFVESSGGSQNVTANPQISAGVTVGQELYLRGSSDTDYLVLSDGNGLALNGSFQLKRYSAIDLIWDGSVWSEISRR